MEREELLERLLELKGKVPLAASDWELINQALADPTLKKDLEMLELLDTLEDEVRLQASDDAAFLRFQLKLDRHQNKKVVDSEPSPHKRDSSWWAAITKPRRPWGLPLVLAQLVLFSVYFNLTSVQDSTDIIIEQYRSERIFDTCEVVKVTFNPEITIQEISDVLKKANLKILSGPVSANEYVISRGYFSGEQLQGFFERIGEVNLSDCERLQSK